MASQVAVLPGKRVGLTKCSRCDDQVSKGSSEAQQENFEQAVVLSLHLWPALNLAVQNGWSDNDAEDVRAWFAGVVVELFPSFVDLAKLSNQAQGSTKPAELEEPDTSDVESRLLQVMADEYDVVVDDDSSFEVAEQIIRLRGSCAKGQFNDVDALRTRWLSSKGKKVVMQQKADPDQDTDWEDDDEDDDEGDDDEDVNMGEVPSLVAAPKQKPQPEVDEDGFTKVTRKKQ
jgi:pre-rRNA-processing protein TSR2